MSATLIDKAKFQDALWEARQNIHFRTQFVGHVSSNPMEALNDSIRCLVHEEAKILIKEALELFIDDLTCRLDSCEPNKYPCALCHEEENGSKN